MSFTQNTPRVGQSLGPVQNEGNGLIAKMGLWLQQTLKYLGRNPENTVTAIVPGPSPFTYTNEGDFDQSVVISGGVVSLIVFTRGGVGYTVANATGQTVLLNPGDSVQVTYAAPPNFILIPR